MQDSELESTKKPVAAAVNYLKTIYLEGEVYFAQGQEGVADATHRCVITRRLLDASIIAGRLEDQDLSDKLNKLREDIWKLKLPR